MSPELDTYSITKRVKEVLTDNNLGTCQGSACSPRLAFLGFEQNATGTFR